MGAAFILILSPSLVATARPYSKLSFSKDIECSKAVRDHLRSKVNKVLPTESNTKNISLIISILKLLAPCTEIAGLELENEAHIQDCQWDVMDEIHMVWLVGREFETYEDKKVLHKDDFFKVKEALVHTLDVLEKWNKKERSCLHLVVEKD